MYGRVIPRHWQGSADTRLGIASMALCTEGTAIGNLQTGSWGRCLAGAQQNIVARQGINKTMSTRMGAVGIALYYRGRHCMQLVDQRQGVVLQGKEGTIAVLRKNS